ncbi:MAG: hypothetical protein ABIF87_11720 [Pseudomonadota bacterium]
MIIAANICKKMIAGVSLAVLILVTTLLWAGDSVFTEYPAGKLKIIEVNKETQTVLIESPDGDTATLTTGDIMGQEEATIVEIQKGGIVLEEGPNDFGVKIRSHVPVGPRGAAAVGQ